MNDLLERRNHAAAEMKRYLTEAGTEPMTAEAEAAFDKAAADYDRLDATITRSQRVAALSAPVASGVATANDTPAVEKSEQHRAFEDFVRHGIYGPGLQRATDMETRAQGVATGSAGGFLVPEGFRDAIIRATKDFGGLRALAQVITTTSGNELPYPTVDDTGNVGELIGENTAVLEQDVVVGNKVLKAYKWSSRLVRVANELLQDEAYNLETELGSILGERIGRAQAPLFLTGTGTNQPEGLLTNATAGVTLTTGQTTGWSSSANAYDSLIDLEHSVDRSYRAGSSWVMNDLTVAKARKIKDADGRPIWQASLAAGAPSTINGYPVITDAAMPTFAANAKVAAFGNIRAAYVIRDVLAIAVRRLNERYAEFDQTGFIGFSRADAQVQNAGAVRVLVASAT